MQNQKHLINRYFDHVYVVNLSFDRERRVRIHHLLKKQGISFSFFSATYGYRGDALKKFEKYQARRPGNLKRYSEHNELERQRGFGFIESPGAMGYIFSYLRLLKEARKNRLDRILILEDDIIFSRDFNNRFDSLIGHLPNDWKVLQLGASQYNWESVDIEAAIQTGYYLPRTVDTCGSFALALHSSIFDELIEAAESFETTFDLLALGEIYERYVGKCFVAYPNIVMPDVTTSHIRGYRNQFKQAEIMKWRMEDFEFPPSKPVVALLIESKADLPSTLLRQNQRNASIYLNVYVNTPDGLRPIHHEDNISRYEDVLVPFKEMVKLPFADHCFKLSHGQKISYLEILAALEHDEGPHSANKLTPWSFEVAERVPGRVSVILPAWGNVDHMLDAIDSVLTQEGVDFEILIVDDQHHPSPDAERVRAHLALTSALSASTRIEYIEHTKYLNDAAARNTGIIASTGEFICFLDGNSTYLPDRLSASVQALKSTKKEFGAIYCGYLEWESPENNQARYPVDDLDRYLLALEHEKHYIHTDTVTYRFAELIKINGFDESYTSHSDIEFNLRFLGVSSLGTLEKALVRLKPKSKGQDNHLLSSDLFKDKIKFLSEFQLIISNQAESEPKVIFDAHLSELLKYIDSQEDLAGELVGSEKRKTAFQIQTLLSHQLRNEAKECDSGYLRKLTDTQLALELSQQQLQEQLQHIQEIETSLTWRISKVWRNPIFARFLPFLDSHDNHKT